MSKPLLDIGPQQIMSGFAPDLAPSRAPLWVAGENVIFDDGAVRGVPQQKLFINSEDGAPVLGLASFVINGTFYVFWGTATKLYSWTAAGGTLTEGSGYNGSAVAVGDVPGTAWMFRRHADDWVVATNGNATDGMLVWKGSATDFVALGGTPPSKAQIIVNRTPHLVAFNTDLGDNYAEWCKEGDVEDWVPGVGSSAGNLPIQGLNSPITAAELMGPEIVFYTETSQHLLPLNAAPIYFGERKLQQGPGCVGKHALAAVGNYHFGFGNEFVWKADYSSWRPIDDGWVNKSIYENFNREQRSRVVLEHFPLYSLVVVHFPGSGATYPNRALAYNYKYDFWNPEFTLERTAVDRQPGSVYRLSANKSGYIFDWSDVSAPGQAQTAGPLSLTVPDATLEIGWRRGGWRGFPWRGKETVSG